jgi:aspartyl-tRNA(Asn)/glutamyl-tRNA(Gln) amidotransferase subunit A
VGPSKGELWNPQATSAAEALRFLSENRTTATDLTRQALMAAEACRANVNAFSVIAHDSAVKAAEISEARYAARAPRLLEGLPIVVKDLIDTEGLETRYGSAAYAGNVPRADAEVVRILRECGAIVIGKTTTHEFAWGVTTSSPIFGDTLNPRNPAHIPGGSSGGTAAAIAFGASWAGLGTDTGGSVRIPAALCGVAGMKPTKGRLPSTGIFPLAQTLDHPGLMGGCVGDIALLAKVFGIEASRTEVPPRVAYINGIKPVPLHDEVAQSFGRARAMLDRHFRGVALAEKDLFDGVFAAFAGIVLTEGSVVHFGRNDEATIRRSYTPETIERLDRAKGVSIGEYVNWQRAGRAFTERLLQVMSSIDFLLLPTCPCAAPRSGQTEVAIGPWRGTVREALMAYTAPFNVAGFPAMSIPLPTPPDALPCGIQVVGRPNQDGELLQFSGRVEAILAAGLGGRPSSSRDDLG